ncbi:hypothetical protein H2248_007991, partial [Termitomyces sp. 'cryptogamus']
VVINAHKVVWAHASKLNSAKSTVAKLVVVVAPAASTSVWTVESSASIDTIATMLPESPVSRKYAKE